MVSYFEVQKLLVLYVVVQECTPVVLAQFQTEKESTVESWCSLLNQCLTPQMVSIKYQVFCIKGKKYVVLAYQNYVPKKIIYTQSVVLQFLSVI